MSPDLFQNHKYMFLTRNKKTIIQTWRIGTALFSHPKHIKDLIVARASTQAKAIQKTNICMN